MNSIILKNQNDVTLWKGNATAAHRNQIVNKLRNGAFLMKGEYLKVSINNKELKAKSLEKLIDALEMQIRELIKNEDSIF